jgi:hypothetical protein
MAAGSDGRGGADHAGLVAAMIGKLLVVALALVGALSLLNVIGWLVLLYVTRDKEHKVVTCQLCGERLKGTGRDADADVLLTATHMRLLHPDREIELWPDGMPVIVDETLKPGDFT